MFSLSVSGLLFWWRLMTSPAQWRPLPLGFPPPPQPAPRGRFGLLACKPFSLRPPTRADWPLLQRRAPLGVAPAPFPVPPVNLHAAPRADSKYHLESGLYQPDEDPHEFSVTQVPISPKENSLSGGVENGCVSAPHNARPRRPRESHGRRGLLRRACVTRPHESGGSSVFGRCQAPCASVYETGWLWPLPITNT